MDGLTEARIEAEREAFSRAIQRVHKMVDEKYQSGRPVEFRTLDAAAKGLSLTERAARALVDKIIGRNRNSPR